MAASSWVKELHDKQQRQQKEADAQELVRLRGYIEKAVREGKTLLQLSSDRLVPDKAWRCLEEEGLCFEYLDEYKQYANIGFCGAPGSVWVEKLRAQQNKQRQAAEAQRLAKEVALLRGLIEQAVAERNSLIEVHPLVCDEAWRSLEAEGIVFHFLDEYKQYARFEL